MRKNNATTHKYLIMTLTALPLLLYTTRHIIPDTFYTPPNNFMKFQKHLTMSKCLPEISPPSKIFDSTILDWPCITLYRTNTVKCHFTKRVR